MFELFGLNEASERGIERLKFHYVYTDNSLPDHPIIFECEADSIPQADELFELNMGFRHDDKDVSRGYTEN